MERIDFRFDLVVLDFEDAVRLERFDSILDGLGFWFLEIFART
jgi:citrate lyase beta subunit